MEKTLVVGNRKIGQGYPCFIIAEIGINHNGDINLAKDMVYKAKECGVDAVKFQTFKACEFVSDPNQTYTYYSEGKKITESMMTMFERYELSKEAWREIFDYCKSLDILVFSTPQNKTDLDFLLSLVDLPLIKVGADDLTNLDLLEYYASKGRPLIISAGMAYLSEIEDAVNTIRDTGNENFAVLHCVSSYPALANEMNLKKIQTINRAFNVVTGFSDHSIGSYAAVGAVTMGASIFEKHFTMNKNLPGPDHWFASDPDELKSIVTGIRFIEEALGSYEIKPTENELEMREICRRSIVAKRKINCGQEITIDDICYKRRRDRVTTKIFKIGNWKNCQMRYIN